MKGTQKEEKLITVIDVGLMLSCSVRTVWRLVEARKLPQPIRYNRKLVRWRLSDIKRHIEEGNGGGK